MEGLRTVFTLPDGRDAAAVDGVSFHVGRGETLGLVGESGSGKSVTALSIIRLVMPPGRITAGRVEFEGRNLLELAEEPMRQVRGRRIGFVFQEPMAALESRLHDRIPDPRNVDGARPGAGRGGEEARRSSCSKPCACPIRRDARRNTRIS